MGREQRIANKQESKQTVLPHRHLPFCILVQPIMNERSSPSEELTQLHLFNITYEYIFIYIPIYTYFILVSYVCMPGEKKITPYHPSNPYLVSCGSKCLWVFGLCAHCCKTYGDTPRSRKGSTRH